MSLNDSDNDLLLLPQSATELERILSSVDRRQLSLPTDLIKDVHDFDRCPPEWLPLLAVAWSVDEWNPDWSEETKRNAIKASLSIHKKKGTAAALKEAIAVLGMDAVVEEWFEYAGQPYRFRITAKFKEQPFTQNEIATLTRVALATKNVRSYFEGLTWARDIDAPIKAGIAHLRVVTATFGPLQSPFTPPNSPLYAGGAYTSRITATFDPLP